MAGYYKLIFEDARRGACKGPFKGEQGRLSVPCILGRRTPSKLEYRETTSTYRPTGDKPRLFGTLDRREQVKAKVILLRVVIQDEYHLDQSAIAYYVL